MKNTKLIITISAAILLMLSGLMLGIMGGKIFAESVDLVVVGTGSSSAAATEDALEKLMEQIMPAAIATSFIMCGVALLVFGILLATKLKDKITGEVKNNKVIKIIAIILVAVCLFDTLTAQMYIDEPVALKVPSLILLVLTLGLLIASVVINGTPVYASSSPYNNYEVTDDSDKEQ